MANKEKEERIKMMLNQVKQNDDGHYNYIIPEFLARKVASHMLIEEDLLHARAAIEKLIQSKDSNNRDNIIETCLWKSAIASYGKCFNSNKGGYSVLDPKVIFDGKQELLDDHYNMMDVRNSFVSHRDETEHENVVVIMKVPKEEGNAQLDKTEFSIKSLLTGSPSTDILKKYLAVIECILPINRDRIQSSTQKTFYKLMDSLTPEEITFLLIR